MRVRITKPLVGSIDGIQLSRLSQGQVYDVATSLACYLLSEEMAEPAGTDEPIAVLPVDRKLFERPEERTKGLILPPSVAEDRARKLRARSRKKKKKES